MKAATDSESAGISRHLPVGAEVQPDGGTHCPECTPEGSVPEPQTAVRHCHERRLRNRGKVGLAHARPPMKSVPPGCGDACRAVQVSPKSNCLCASCDSAGLKASVAGADCGFWKSETSHRPRLIFVLPIWIPSGVTSTVRLAVLA